MLRIFWAGLPELRQSAAVDTGVVGALEAYKQVRIVLLRETESTWLSVPRASLLAQPPAFTCWVSRTAGTAAVGSEAKLIPHNRG